MNDILGGLSPYKLLELVFFAGVTYAGFRSAVKQLNGMGSRMRAEIERRNFQFLTTVVAGLIGEDNRERREKLGKMYLEAGFPEGRR